MDETQKPLTIFVDADACPIGAKEILYRTANRLKIELILVSNQPMRVPTSGLIKHILVSDGPDIADDQIVELMKKGDVVITNDIPLAARVVEKEGIALGTRGELYDEDRIHERLASRNLMEELRSGGMMLGGPKPQNQKDLQLFANQLDKTLTRLLKD